jgi:hypothetical protein
MIISWCIGFGFGFFATRAIVAVLRKEQSALLYAFVALLYLGALILL